jgi:hypothetical protein
VLLVEVDLAAGPLEDQVTALQAAAEAFAARDRAIPGGTPAAGAAAVGDDDREPLLGEPLGGEEGTGGLHDPLVVRAAVGVHGHRQPGAELVPGRKSTAVRFLPVA